MQTNAYTFASYEIHRSALYFAFNIATKTRATQLLPHLFYVILVISPSVHFDCVINRLHPGCMSFQHLRFVYIENSNITSLLESTPGVNLHCALSYILSLSIIFPQQLHMAEINTPRELRHSLQCCGVVLREHHFRNCVEQEKTSLNGLLLLRTANLNMCVDIYPYEMHVHMYNFTYYFRKIYECHKLLYFLICLQLMAANKFAVVQLLFN